MTDDQPPRVSDDEMIALAKDNPQELIRRIDASELRVSDLTFAVEYLGEWSPAELSAPILLRHMKHGDALVREGALAGCWKDPVRHWPGIKEAVAAAAKEDPSRVVREGAASALEDWDL